MQHKLIFSLPQMIWIVLFTVLLTTQPILT